MSMNRDHLWAKSKKEDEPFVPSMLLPRHLEDVHDAAAQVLDATETDQLVALGLDPKQYRERFRRCVLLAAALHDLGKANDHFQDMICKRRDVRQNPQGLRHEWVSVLLIREKLRNWLLPAVNGSETDLTIVEWAIGGHHLAYGRPSPPRREAPRGEGIKLQVLIEHPQFPECLSAAEQIEGIGAAPRLGSTWELLLVGKDNLFDRITAWHNDSLELFGAFSIDEQRFTAAVKAALIAADVAGSAVPRLPDKAPWIADAFAKTPQSEDLQAIVRRRLRGGALREFQEQVAASTSMVTFVKAGCGSGKSLAAYQRAAVRYPGKRLYFCYPTTGTATEGFRDYLYISEAEVEDGDNQQVRALKARLFHGRADVDMALIVRGDDERAEADAANRIESLDAWSTPVVNCTVDTVLGLMQNVRRGIYAWPALAGSAFVFDEIHAYDDKLFGALLRFLQHLPGVPVLLMTASLPQARLSALRDCLKRAKREPMAEVAGPEELELLPRYHRESCPSDLAARLRVETERRGKVLWICNTVNRAMAAADSIAELRPKIYHSRFRYYDRVQRHAGLITAFAAEGPAVACATQVAEMSLDLSATLLVTELAPISALIQRLGRLNRKAIKGSSTCPFIVIDVGEDHLPYPPEELQAAREWLAKLPDGAISQRDLSNAWEACDVSRRPNGVESMWFEGGPETEVGDLRDLSSGITVVLEQDAPCLRSGELQLAEAMLPMPNPRRHEWRAWPTIRGIPIAPATTIQYDPLRGAQWEK